MLEAGVGPALPVGARCPACAGELGRWGSYSRLVRRFGGTFKVRIRRAICRSCGATHALLPGFLFARRLDLAEAIGRALWLAVEGLGHRRVAGALGVPETTARSWLRRLRGRSDSLRRGFVRLAQELGQGGSRAPPSGDPLVWLLEAIGAAHGAARERFGPASVGSVWAFSSAASGGLLLANTGSPFPA